MTGGPEWGSSLPYPTAKYQRIRKADGGSTAAAQVLDAALARFPDEAQQLESQKEIILEQAEKTGTPEELENLRSLGYIGR